MLVKHFGRISSLNGIFISRLISTSSVLKTTQKNEAMIEDPIVFTDDGTTIVCWHPEKEFPYECTKPMPAVQVRETTVLKRSVQEAVEVFHKKRPENEVREELAKLTQTTIHRWFPRSRDKKAKKTPPDRPYL